MTTKIRPRTLAVLAAFIGLLGAVVVTSESSGAVVEPSVVRLNLGSDGRFFEYGPPTTPPTPRQNLTTPQNGCQITSAESLIDLSSTPIVTPASKSSSPGLGPDGIGVRQSPSSGNGTPCSQVESTETLTLRPSTASGNPIANKLFKGVRLDLEMTGNALVKLTFSGGATPTPVDYYLQTGSSITDDQKGPPPIGPEADYDTTAPYLVSSVGNETVDACAAPNSSGPNSGMNDNCQWTVMPLRSFSTMTLTTTRGAMGALGAVSLEGGGDFPLGSDNDSLFLIANSGPTAVNDGPNALYTTLEDQRLSGDVTGNDTDPDGDTLTGAIATSGPSHGVLNLAPDGTFSYDPDDDYNGPDSFTYTVSDGSVTSNPATVSLTVTAVNDAPTATGDGLDIEEDSTGTVHVADDVDEGDGPTGEGDTLTVECDEPEGWAVVDLGGGNVKITPPADFVGEITIDCTVTDSHGVTTASPVTIAVGVTNANDAPVAADDEAEFNPAIGASLAIDVLANDSDIDVGDALSVENLSFPDGGSATVAGGIVTYTPPEEIDAPVTFTYQAFDGEEYSNTATVTVYPLICSDKSVSTETGDVSGFFYRLSDPLACKRYTLEVALNPNGDTILFQPSGDPLLPPVEYRGVVTFGPDVNPPLGADSLRLTYDPTGGFDLDPMQWCIAPEFDVDEIIESDDGVPLFATVTGATLPGEETWCIASAHTQGDENGIKVTYFQLYGTADPRIAK